MGRVDAGVIPERRVHAKGSGAFGTLTVTHDISRFTKAKVFAEVPVAVARFRKHLKFENMVQLKWPVT